jgi:hypothetical protein
VKNATAINPKSGKRRSRGKWMSVELGVCPSGGAADLLSRAMEGSPAVHDTRKDSGGQSI